MSGSILTEESSKEEIPNRNAYNRWADIHEPIRNKRCESQEKHVEECVFFVVLYFLVEFAEHGREVFQN